MIEELDTENVRFAVMDTRKFPGVKEKDRPAAIEDGDMVIHLAGGWHAGPRALPRNTTMVSYGHQGSLGLAETMADYIGQWGACYVFGHSTANPRRVNEKQNPLIQRPHSIAIEPFFLNGPDVQEYMKRGSELGTVIARCVAGYLREKGVAIPARSPALAALR